MMNTSVYRHVRSPSYEVDITMSKVDCWIRCTLLYIDKYALLRIYYIDISTNKETVRFFTELARCLIELWEVVYEIFLRKE